MSRLDDHIGKQTLDLFGETYTIAELTGLDEAKIYQAVSTNASRLTYFGAMCATAEAEYNRSKTHLEELDATIKLDILDNLSAGEKKPTDKIMDAMVKADEEYCNAVEKMHQMLRAFKTLKALVNGLEHRAFQIQSVTADLRSERKINETERIARLGWEPTKVSRRKPDAEDIPEVE